MVSIGRAREFARPDLEGREKVIDQTGTALDPLRSAVNEADAAAVILPSTISDQPSFYMPADADADSVLTPYLEKAKTFLQAVGDKLPSYVKDFVDDFEIAGSSKSDPRFRSRSPLPTSRCRLSDSSTVQMPSSCIMVTHASWIPLGQSTPETRMLTKQKPPPACSKSCPPSLRCRRNTSSLSSTTSSTARGRRSVSLVWPTLPRTATSTSRLPRLCRRVSNL